VSRALVRAIAVAVLGSITGAAALLIVYGFNPALTMALDVSPPSAVTGLYATERDPASGLTFAWTEEVLTIRLSGLDRQVPWQLEGRVRAARPDPSTNPELAIFADGSHVVTIPSTTEFADIDVPIPARPDRRGLTISVRSSATMVPGPHDRRKLGVMIDWLALSPEGIVVPPRRALAAAALVPAIAAAALALAGATGLSAAAAATVMAALTAGVLARGFGPYTEYGHHAILLSSWIWIATLAIIVLVRGARRRAFSSRALFVIGFSACAAILKLLVLLHPDMPIGDAMFHAHRFHDVLSGKLYFTSIAPGNYSFPYAPGLYVAAMPLANLVARGAADMSLLRIIVVVVDTVAASLLYMAIVSQQTDTTGPGMGMGARRMAGACAVVLYHLVPLDYRIVTVGNLTNVFAQSLATIALALMAAHARAASTNAYGLMLALVLAFAFLSHTSTFATGAAGTALVAALFYVRGGPRLRPNAVAIALALGVAATAATVLYYAHFADTYRTEWARISAETATAAPDAGGRTIAGRLAALPRNLYIYLGAPVLVLAAAGATAMSRQLGNAPLTLGISGWLLSCLFFLVLGILTPVDMRHYLAAIPALAIAAGIGAADLWSARGNRRSIGVILLAWACAIGLHGWFSTI
jgi:hypothetical protein